MKIASVDNTNFKGKFYNNKLLEKVLANAEERDLKDFFEILKSMERKNDGQEFYLGVDSQPMIGGKFLNLKGNKNFHAIRVLQPWDDRTEKVWFSTLTNINRMLIGRYPPIKEIPPKEKLLQEIYNKLA